MYEQITRQIRTITEQIRNGSDVDLSTLPLPQIMQMIEASREHLKKTGGLSPYAPIVKLLDNLSENADLEGLCAIFDLAAVALDDMDQVLAREELIAHYRGIVIKRMPEYLYLKNKERLRDYHKTHPATDRVPFRGKGVVYTVITGNYDTPLKPLNVNPDWDYILFTDRDDLEADGWEIRRLDDPDGLGRIRLSRKPKILCHEYLSDYDFSVYLDGNLQIRGDLREYIDRYSTGESMLCVNHYINADAYEEAVLCKDNGRDDASVIDAQMDRYRAEGFPEGYGLTSNNFLIRDHRDEKMKKVMESWWQEFLSASKRDQLSFTYCCWKNDFLYDTSPLFVAENDYLLMVKHKGK